MSKSTHAVGRSAPAMALVFGVWPTMLMAAAMTLVDLWAFVALGLLWAVLLPSAFFLYRWLWKHDDEETEDFHLGL